MMNQLEDIKAFAATLPVRHIENERGEVYLSRYNIRGWMPGDVHRFPMHVYLHQIHIPDADPAPHSHPWEWSNTTVLNGSYTQEYGFMINGKMVLAPNENILQEGETFLMGEGFFHRITSVRPETWTLFVTGPKTTREPSWGFYVDGRVVAWRERLIQRGITPQY